MASIHRGLFPLLLLGVCACSAGIPSENSSARMDVAQPLCHVGCVETDPFPDSAGVFLGSGVTGDLCFADGGQTDHDGDGLSTFCENNLAAAFAPELYHWAYDEVGREPYWAARPVPASSGDTVKIAYLIGYYRDAGSSAYLCQLPPPLWHPSCEGHNGDSEMILLRVYYNYDTQHWVLSQARYSQHESYGVYDRGSAAYPTTLTYPAHAGAFPRAYVSQGQHANYSSASECNAGGAFNTDTCGQVDTPARLVVGAAYNVGSSAVRLIDCVASRNPAYVYYGSGRQECYWTTRRFRGWIPTTVGGLDSSPYSERLAAEGF